MAIYVALGSSFASGPGIDPIIDAGCGRPGNNYAHLLAARLGYHLIDVSSGGAAVRPIPTVRRPRPAPFSGHRSIAGPWTPRWVRYPGRWPAW